MSGFRGRVLTAVMSTLSLIVGIGVVAGPASPAAAQILPFGPWQAVAAGGSHSCAIKLGSTLWCWGANSSGQLGIGAVTLPQLVPVQVGAQSDWASVTTGDSHTCGLKINGERYCWGDNIFGQLGLTGGNRVSPTRIIGEFSWSSLEAGYHHTCGIRDNGRPYCWGRNHHGQLGVGDTVKRELPAQVSTNTWHSVSAGGDHSCGIRSDQVRFCWGSNGSGQLGLGDFFNRTTPIRRLSETADWDVVTAGEHHTCGIQGLLLSCWGNNVFGQLGVGDNTIRNLPTVNGIGFTAVVPGGFHTCRLANSTRSCTGSGNLGALGLGHYSDRQVFSGYRADQAWKSLGSGKGHTCGVSTINRLYCWGDNSSGQLGIGDTTPTRNVPSLVG